MLGSKTIIRWGSLAGVLAGLLLVVGVFVNLAFQGSAILIIVLVLLGILGIFLQVQSAGRGQIAIIGGLGVLVGAILLIFSQNLLLTGIFFGVGLLVLVFGMYQSGGYPIWVIFLWALAPILGVLGLIGVGPQAILQQVGAVLLGLGLMGAGYTLWMRKG